MFHVEKFLAPLFFPLSLALLGLGAGLGLLWLSRWQRAGKALVTASVAFLAVVSHGWTSNALLRPLEREQSVFAPTGAIPPEWQGLRWIVVLGGGVSADESLPPTQRLSNASLQRLAEGIRLQRLLPAARLVTSGGAVFASPSSGEVMREAACALGAPPERVTVQPTGRNTVEEVAALAAIVGMEPFLLVTSAAHMPRALDACRAQGLMPLPAPTDFLTTGGDGVWTPGDIYPSGAALHQSERAAYEYLGRLRWRRQ
ncbi:MAG: envelope biogenesis factor ElyC [Chloracidobacterium sp. CP2_5A]|nr:MAG: envelope biogenesis factor ElyC [Chloracidobacterium sp. CP2_5A]